MGCCAPPPPQDEEKAKQQLIFGILNLFFPGFATAIYGCMSGQGDVTTTGLLQLVAYLLFGAGAVWGFIYGIMMIVQGSSFKGSNQVIVVQQPPPSHQV